MASPEFNVEFDGMDDLITGLSIAPDVLEGALKVAMTDSILFTEAEIKDRTPRPVPGGGELQAAWFGHIEQVGPLLVGHVSNPLRHARWIEEGDPDVIRPIRARALHFWYKGQEMFRNYVTSPKKHMAREGLEVSKPVILEIFRSTLQTALKLIK